MKPNGRASSGREWLEHWDYLGRATPLPSRRVFTRSGIAEAERLPAFVCEPANDNATRWQTLRLIAWLRNPNASRRPY